MSTMKNIRHFPIDSIAANVVPKSEWFRHPMQMLVAVDTPGSRTRSWRA